MALESKQVSVSNIYLDLNNYRHEPLNSEPIAIAHLLAEQDVLPLARHIASKGRTSPLELMALVPHPKVKNAFITAEGNRRLCALKLLQDPDKADTEAHKAIFRELQSTLHAPIDAVAAIIFPDMESANPWVELRHDAPPGVGTKRWESADRARFNREQGRGNTPNQLALALLEYAKARQLLPDADLTRLRGQITTLTRFLSTPDVRSALGIASNRELLINASTEEFERAATQFLRDALASDSKVNSRTSSPMRKTYSEDFRARGYSPDTRTPDARAPGADTPPAPAQAPISQRGSTPTVRNRRNRDNDKFVIPGGYVARVDDAVFQRLFRELRQVDAEAFSFSATYLLRALIERAAHLFIHKHNIQPVPEALHTKLQRVAEKLKEQGFKGKGMTALRKMSTDIDSRYSPDTIGNFVHGGQIPTRVYVIRAWDTFEPTMTEIVRQLTAK